jgi:hypothetical protein
MCAGRVVLETAPDVSTLRTARKGRPELECKSTTTRAFLSQLFVQPIPVQQAITVLFEQEGWNHLTLRGFHDGRTRSTIGAVSTHYLGADRGDVRIEFIAELENTRLAISLFWDRNEGDVETMSKPRSDFGEGIITGQAPAALVQLGTRLLAHGFRFTESSLQHAPESGYMYFHLGRQQRGRCTPNGLRVSLSWGEFIRDVRSPGSWNTTPGE